MATLQLWRIHTETIQQQTALSKKISRQCEDQADIMIADKLHAFDRLYTTKTPEEGRWLTKLVEMKEAQV